MNRTAIFAHRGAKREAAENTRTAFDKALHYAIDGIETDIQLSRDEVAVLWHDDDLKKLGLPGKRIDDYDFAQLRAMNFAAHFAGAAPLPNPLPQAGEGANESLREFFINEGVMGLQEFVTRYHRRCRLLLEIKRYPGEVETRQLIKVMRVVMLAQLAATSGILTSSFDLESLIHAHRLAPQIPLVFNLEPEHQTDFAQRALIEQSFLHGLCVHISTLDEAMVGVVRECGKFIAVYTCNSDDQINQALNLGVDVLISDVPQKALQMRSEKNE